MKIAVTGLSNSGKTTVFNALTGMGVETTAYATTSGDPHMGVVKVPDERIWKLSEVFSPKKTTPSTVQYVDYLGLTKGDLKQNRKVFELVKDSDALVHVVRAFEDDAVVHPLEKVDPQADISTVETELVFGDLELVERRLDAIALNKKKGNKPAIPEEEKVLGKCREALEGERPLRDAGLTEDDLKAVRHLQFMSIKPMIVALNIEEDDLGGPKAAGLVKEAQDLFGEGSSVTVLALCGRVEMELSEMEGQDHDELLKEYGISEPALDRLIHISYESVGLISFFTVGEDEVKAWSIRKGTEALEAAGKIHSDIQRGFIRAETISYDDFIEKAGGSLSAARDKGLMRLEGKTYIVKDGDIINFRFNV
jgi:GTP-binding protein YchF